MSVKDFENERWRTTPQKKEFRHLSTLELVREGTVLDVGCGDGLLLKLLREEGVTASGVDISSEAVAQCRAAGFVAQEHSLDNPLPYPDNAFDTVTLLDVLEHVYDPLFVLREARRVAKERVIVGVPNFSSLPARLQTLLGKVPENNHPNKGHLYWFNYPVLMTLAAQAGLGVGQLLMNSFSVFTKMKGLVRALPNLLALSFVAELKK